MKSIDNETIRNVTGGNAVTFEDGQPVCPICGAMGARMKIIDSTPTVTTYQCELCNQISTFEAPQKETPVTSCPRCGATGEAFRVMKDNGNTVRCRCMVCNYETDSVK